MLFDLPAVSRGAVDGRSWRPRAPRLLGSAERLAEAGLCGDRGPHFGRSRGLLSLIKLRKNTFERDYHAAQRCDKTPSLVRSTPQLAAGSGIDERCPVEQRGGIMI